MEFYDLLSSIGFVIPDKKDKFKKEISFIERKTGFAMPQSFHKIMNCCSGKQPVISTVDYIHPLININMKARYFRLLNVDIHKSKENTLTNNVINLMEIVKRNFDDEQQAEKLVPFAYVNHHDILFLDFTHGNSPTVIMIQDDMLIPIAHSIEDLLLKIKDYFRFQQVLLTQYVREMRATQIYGKVFESCNRTYLDIEAVASKILSEEGCRILVSSNKYMQQDLEEAVYSLTIDGMGQEDTTSVLTYEFSDISWSKEITKPCNIGDIVNFERKIDSKLPKELRLHLMTEESLSPEHLNRISINYNNRHYMFNFSLLSLNQYDDNQGSVASEVHERLLTLASETLDTTLSKQLKVMVPFAKLEEENGYLCFDYSLEEPSVIVLFTPGDQNELSEMDDLFDENLQWAFCPIAISFNDFINSIHYEAELNTLRYQQISRYTTLTSFNKERLEELEGILSTLSQ